MLENVKQFTDFLLKWDITPNQFFLCWLLFWDHHEYEDRKLTKGGKRMNPNDKSAAVNLYRYAKKGKSWNKQEISDLQDKGLIAPTNDKKRYVIDSQQVTQKFIDAVLVNREREDEFWESYPSWVQNFNNPSKPDIPLKSCDQDKIKTLYRSLVRTKARHERVMEILNWAKRHEKIKMSIANFVKSRMWEQLEELMEKEGGDIDDSKFGTKTAF